MKRRGVPCFEVKVGARSHDIKSLALVAGELMRISQPKMILQDNYEANKQECLEGDYETPWQQKRKERNQTCPT